MNRDKKLIAVFDFDGTLTTHDMAVRFFFECVPIRRWLARIWCVLPMCVGYGLGVVSRERLKCFVLRAFFAGVSRQEMEEKGRRFFDETVRRYWNHRVVERLVELKEQGAYVMVLSANFTFLVDPIQHYLPVDEVIATRVVFDAQRGMTGQIAGKNCWGEQKVLRLEMACEAFGSQGVYVVAFGDSSGDGPMLAAADEGYFVQGDRWTRIVPKS